MNPAVRDSPLVVTRSAIRGLTRRELGFLPVFAQSVAAIAPAGTSVITPPFVIAAVGGSAGVAVFLGAAVLAWCVALVIRPMAQRLAVTGGLYTYVAQGLGPAVAIPAGWSALAGYLSVSVAGLIAVGGAVRQVLGGGPAATVALVLVAALVAAVLMARGIRISAAAMLIVECVSAIAIVALLTYLLVTARPGASLGAAARGHGDVGDLAISAVVAISAFVGFESATTLSSEAYRPFRSVPRTLVWTPVAAAVIYLFAVAAEAVAFSAGGSSLAEVLLRDDSPFLAIVPSVAVASSFFACTVASVNAAVRVLFTMAREGIAPAAAGRTHPRFHTPMPALVSVVVVVTGAAVVTLLAGVTPSDGIRVFLTLSGLGYLGSYLPACLAGPALLRRIGEPSRRVSALGWGCAVLMAVLVVLAAFGREPGTAVVVTGYVAIMVVAVLVTGVVRLVAPARWRRIGIFDEPRREDLLHTAVFR
ncbi:APC family permease [Nocardia stercoris]|uniref:APC family permease n=1 Tax=Nocardia stercoris TaxID=2483361 RepID=A0A3M2KYN2_9NOCA|nr:APC family permease [Nocardia stercoris]RMI30572.1 APC family permease [Nocardia stercoris]